MFPLPLLASPRSQLPAAAADPGGIQLPSAVPGQYGGVCADEPAARRLAGYRAGPAVRRGPGPAGWPAGRDHRGAASAAATGDQGLVACGRACFRGRAARCVSEQRALSWPALWADQIPRFLEGSSCRPGRRCCCTPRSCASTCRSPKARKGMAAGRADRPRARHARGNASTRSPSSGVRRRRRWPVPDPDTDRFRLPPRPARRGPAPPATRLGLMHRYSNLTWWMRRLPERRRASIQSYPQKWR